MNGHTDTTTDKQPRTQKHEHVDEQSEANQTNPKPSRTKHVETKQTTKERNTKLEWQHKTNLTREQTNKQTS